MKTPEKFAIGSKILPGLSKASEEAAELIQVCQKFIGSDGDPSYFDETDLNKRLIEEAGDCLAAITYLTHVNNIADAVLARAEKKIDLYFTWHDAATHE